MQNLRNDFISGLIVIIFADNLLLSQAYFHRSYMRFRYLSYLAYTYVSHALINKKTVCIFCVIFA
jgi:hypothetical protein